MSLIDLEKAEGIIKTQMGRSYLGKRVVYRGKDLHFDLSQMQWIELLAFGITGKNYSLEEVKLMNYMWVSTSYPDKSIWPNHIAALAGTARTTPGLGLAAGLASSEAAIFGGKPLRVAIDFFIRAKGVKDRGDCLKEFVLTELATHRVVFGYGRPLAKTDERVPHVIKFVLDSGLIKLEHFHIAIDVANILKESKRISMNVAALYAALGADLGFTPKQFHCFMTTVVYAGMPPCYEEAKENTEGTFLPVRCDKIKYTGRARRSWT